MTDTDDARADDDGSDGGRDGDGDHDDHDGHDDADHDDSDRDGGPAGSDGDRNRGADAAGHGGDPARDGDRPPGPDDPPELHVAHAVPPGTRADLIAALRKDGRVPPAAITEGTTPGETRRRAREAAVLATFRLPEGLLGGGEDPRPDGRTDDADGSPGEARPDSPPGNGAGGDRGGASAPENLRLVQALSAGVGGYDRAAFREAGVMLANLSGVHAEPIAEQVFGYALTFERKLHVGARQQRDGVWLRYHGGELRGKTLGVVGVGAIGSRVAELGAAFGMEVLGTRRDTSEVPGAVDELFGPDRESLYEVLGRADYLVLSCPLTDRTRGLIGAAELRTMHREAVLINVARGAVVEESALVRTLRGDGLRGAALDVFETEPLPAESPLWDLPNVLVTPHQSGSTPNWPERTAGILGANYAAVRRGADATAPLGDGPFRNRVV